MNKQINREEQFGEDQVNETEANRRMKTEEIFRKMKALFNS